MAPRPASASGGLVRRLRKYGFLAVMAVVVFLVSILPLLVSIDTSFYEETAFGITSNRSLDAVLSVYGSKEYWSYFLSAVVLATLVTVISVAVGLTMAILVVRTDIPCKPLLENLIILPLFLSPFTGLMAWIALASGRTGFINVFIISAFEGIGVDVGPIFEIWSYSGIAWVMTLFFCPFAYLFTAGTLKSMDASLEEAARVSGARIGYTFLKITVPLILPSVIASGLLIFILAAEMYTIPGIIGARIGFTTLPWQIYEDMTVAPVKQAHAAAASSMLLAVTLIGIWLQRRATRYSERFTTVTGKGLRSTPIRLGKWTWAALAFIGLYIANAVILPFLALLASSFMRYSSAKLSADIFTLNNYIRIFELGNVSSAVWNTLLLAIVSAMIVVSFGVIISYYELRIPSRMAKAVAVLGTLPIAVPGLVYGIGLLWIYLRTPLYGTIWVLLLAYVAKFLPYGIMISRTGLLQLHKDLEEGARMVGASRVKIMQKVTFPLLKPVMIGLVIFVMLMSIKELSASILLYTQRSQVLSVLTWHYMENGDYQLAAAIGMLQSVIMLLLVILARAVFSVRLDRAVGKSAG
jgi:iron(III) transport system permease protein